MYYDGGRKEFLYEVYVVSTESYDMGHFSFAIRFIYYIGCNPASLPS